VRKAANTPPNYENASLDNFQMPQENRIALTGLGEVLLLLI